MTRYEYENLNTALDLAIKNQASTANLVHALTLYVDAIQDHKLGLELFEKVLAGLETYSSDVLEGPIGAELPIMICEAGRCQLLLKRIGEAQESFQKTLDLIEKLDQVDDQLRNKIKAKTYTLLGMVAQDQQKWEQAEQYYQKALEIKIEFNDRHDQAVTYHSLGNLAMEQQRWEQAEQYYQKALEIKIEFNDRYSQANTYHNLGIVVQEQRKWDLSLEYLFEALIIFAEFGDEHDFGFTLRSLFRLWQTSHDEAILEAVAKVLGKMPKDVRDIFENANVTTKEKDESKNI